MTGFQAVKVPHATSSVRQARRALSRAWHNSCYGNSGYRQKKGREYTKILSAICSGLSTPTASELQEIISKLLQSVKDLVHYVGLSTVLAEKVSMLASAYNCAQALLLKPDMFGKPYPTNPQHDLSKQTAATVWSVQWLHRKWLQVLAWVLYQVFSKPSNSQGL
jgi:hypothetical protein